MNSKKCKICRAPSLPFKNFCSPECGATLGLQLLEKKKRAEAKQVRQADKERKEKLKSTKDYADDAQKAVNLYVKWRDWGKPCVSCGTPHRFDVPRDASHLKSRGSNSALRFHLWNLHMSCVRCNMQLSGNIAEYYPRLIERIGAEKVEYLHNAKRSRVYSKEYLIRLKNIFNKKAKRQEKRAVWF
jgi:hypothetical protein